MTRSPSHRLRAAGLRGGILSAAVLGVSVALTACSTGAVAPVASTASPSASSSASASSAPSPAAPALIPNGTAQQNLPFFTSVVDSVWAGPQQTSGRAYIDALAAAGFPKGAMQLTPDQTTIGNPADSIQFSVLWNGTCLVGQVGPAIGKAITEAVPELASGGCLLGNTRPIDW